MVSQWVAARARAAWHVFFVWWGLLPAALTGCDGGVPPPLQSSLIAIGLADTPPGAPVEVALLCDDTIGGPCERSIVEPVVAATIDEVIARPGSRIRVHVLGARPEETRQVASFTVPAEVAGAEATRLRRSQFLAVTRAALCPALDAAMSRPRPRSSPIAEALDEIALARDTRLPLVVLALTDLREVSPLGDFECGPLPTPARFRTKLDARHLIAPGSFARTRVLFAVGDHGPVLRPGCHVSMGRERQVQDIWMHALRRAGTTEIRFASDPPAGPDLRALLADFGADGGAR